MFRSFVHWILPADVYVYVYVCRNDPCVLERWRALMCAFPRLLAHLVSSAVPHFQVRRVSI